MLGKLIGAFAGSQIAKSTRNGVGGPAGAAIGFAVPMLLRRLSFPMIVTLGTGGYLAKKFFDQKDDRTAGTLSVDTDTPTTEPAVVPAAPRT